MPSPGQRQAADPLVVPVVGTAEASHASRFRMRIYLIAGVTSGWSFWEPQAKFILFSPVNDPTLRPLL
jgi:hypothetical protein